MEKEYIERIEDIMEERKRKDPLYVEYDRIINKMFPTKEAEEIFTLGRVHMLSTIKNNMYKYMCKDCKEYFDILIESCKKTDNIKDMANKLIE
jgi:hypothetical protein